MAAFLGRRRAARLGRGSTQRPAGGARGAAPADQAGTERGRGARRWESDLHKAPLQMAPTEGQG